MTTAEYSRLYARARSRWPNLTRQAMTELRATYIEAAKLAAAQVRRATLRGLSDLTSGMYQQLQRQLLDAAIRIQNALDTQIRTTVTTGYQSYAKIETQYVVDAALSAGALEAVGGAVRIRNFFAGINERVLSDMVSRVYQTGYTYSTRVWRAGLDFRNQINRIVTTGVSLNRDVIEIARDIETFVRKDKAALMKRYGDLRYGTKRFTRRIPKRVDWQALRLVRSELTASLQRAAAIAGDNNPGCSGLFDWILQSTGPWKCRCPEYAKNSPYRYDQIPGYPHGNCRCAVRPRMRDQREFVADLKRYYIDGENVPYLDDWSSRLPA